MGAMLTRYRRKSIYVKPLMAIVCQERRGVPVCVWMSWDADVDELDEMHCV